VHVNEVNQVDTPAIYANWVLPYMVQPNSYLLFLKYNLCLNLLSTSLWSRPSKVGHCVPLSPDPFAAWVIELWECGTGITKQGSHKARAPRLLHDFPEARLHPCCYIGVVPSAVWMQSKSEVSVRWEQDPRMLVHHGKWSTQTNILFQTKPHSVWL